MRQKSCIDRLTSLSQLCRILQEMFSLTWWLQVRPQGKSLSEKPKKTLKFAKFFLQWFRILIHWIRSDRIQYFNWIQIRSKNGSGSRVLMTKNIKKLHHKNFFFIFFRKNYNLLILQPFKREHPALQNMKFPNFFIFFGPFLPSWIRIQSGSETLQFLARISSQDSRSCGVKA